MATTTAARISITTTCPQKGNLSSISTPKPRPSGRTILASRHLGQPSGLTSGPSLCWKRQVRLNETPSVASEVLPRVTPRKYPDDERLSLKLETALFVVAFPEMLIVFSLASMVSSQRKSGRFLEI